MGEVPSHQLDDAMLEDITTQQSIHIIQFNYC